MVGGRLQKAIRRFIPSGATQGVELGQTSLASVDPLGMKVPKTLSTSDYPRWGPSTPIELSPLAPPSTDPSGSILPSYGMPPNLGSGATWDFISDYITTDPGSSGADDSAGGDSGGGGSSGDGASGGGTNDTPPAGTPPSGPLQEIFNQIQAGAAELGITMEAYADLLLQNYPWLVGVLGVTTGAALLALIFSIGDTGNGAPPSGGGKKKKKKGKSKMVAIRTAGGDIIHVKAYRGSKPRGPTQKSKKGHRSVRTAGGDVVYYTPSKKGKKSTKGKGRGRWVTFTSHGKKVRFWSKKG